MVDQTQIDALRNAAIPAQGLLIDGTNGPSADGATMDVISPLNGQVFTTIAAGTASDADRAVAAAHARAEPGDVVLLAPAAASFDQYPNFERRGDDFTALVQRLRQG